jgi:hypothetical protein
MLRPGLALLLLAAATAAQGKTDFQRDVLPILQQRCFECHRTAATDAGGKVKKPKGGLALDTKAGILAGGKDGPVLVAGKPADSPLWQRPSLPASDDDRMPPTKDGPGLDTAQLATLQHWIEQGAAFGDWTGASGTDAPAPGSTAAAKAPEDLYAPLAVGLSPLAADVLTRAANGKARIEPVADRSPLLRVAFPGHEDEVTDGDLKALAPLVAHIAVLQLGRTKVTDAGAAAFLAKLPHAVRVDLRETAAGDAVAKAAARLPELHSLDLYASKLTDAGALALAEAKKLDRLYVWQTAVTAAAVVKLREKCPTLHVVYVPDLPDPLPEGQGKRRRGK